MPPRQTARRQTAADRSNARRTAPWLAHSLAAGAVALALGALFAFGAARASAHDALVGSDPADGAQLDAAPGAITLTFSEPPLNIDPQVVVADAAGAPLAHTAPTVNGNAVVAPVPLPLLDGVYRVMWRVVSSDGHPIEGSLSFAVHAPGSSSSHGATADEGPSSTTGRTPTALVAVAASGASSTPAARVVSTTLLLGAVVFVAGATALAVGILWRRRMAGGETDPQDRPPGGAGRP